MDERERDQLWKRVDQYGQRIGDLEQRTVKVETQGTEHGRQLSDMSMAVREVRSSIDQMNGGMRSLRWIGIVLGVLIAIVQIADAIGTI